MSTSQQPTKRKLGLDDIEALDAAVQDYAKRNGVPTTIPAGDRAGEGAHASATVTPFKPKRAPSRRIHIETPLYAIRDLKDKAAADDTTMTYIVLTALRAIGIDIKDADMQDFRRAPK